MTVPTPGQVAWARARALGEPPDLFTVTVTHRRDHPFVKKPDKRKGCAECGLPKAWAGHHGHPPSLNVAGSGANHHAYQNTKRLWQAILASLIDEAGLPRGLGRVFVEGVMCFPDRIERDQGNFRVYLEKALGDALQDGGWLASDSWSRYEFGRLRRAYQKGCAWTRVTLVPAWESEDLTEYVPEPPTRGQGALPIGEAGGADWSDTLESVAVSRPTDGGFDQ